MSESKQSAHLPWVEKHRPKTLDEVSGQEGVVKLLKETVKNKNVPHMLLYGPPGTGKTTSILALAKELYGKEYRNRVLEMNASDERGIGVVRDKIRNFASGAVTTGVPFKLIILDEADSMTREAQSALRRIIEKYTNVTRFCLICNYVSKIIEPLLSRCAMFKFKPLPIESLKLRLDSICDKESIKVSQEAKDEVMRISRGDLRRCITLLQCASQFSENEEVKPEEVIEISGMVPKDVVENLWKAWSSGSFDEAQREVESIIKEGHSAPMLLSQLGRDLLEDSGEYTNDKKRRMFMTLADSEKALVDGADEQLQLLKVVSVFYEILS